MRLIDSQTFLEHLLTKVDSVRKLKIQVQVTVNGFVGGPKGEMDWCLMDWDDKLKKYVGDLTETVDTILLGRVLAEGFIPYWTSHPEEEGADKFIKTKKIVFSNTLKDLPWDNTELATEDLVKAVQGLKEKEGGDLIAYGGARFVSDLIKNNLVDEFHLFVNPVAIKNGLTIFGEINIPQSLKLLKATAFDCGITVLHYAKN